MGAPDGGGTPGDGSVADAGGPDGGAPDAGPAPVQLGIPAILPGVDTNSSGIFGQQFLATVNGAVENLSLYIDSTSSTVFGDRIQLGIYADDGGVPGTLLLNAGSAQNPTPGAWLQMPGSGLALSQGSSYWLVYEVSGPSIVVRNGNWPAICLAPLAFGAMPQHFPPPTVNCNVYGNPWSFYVTVDAGTHLDSMGVTQILPILDMNTAGIFSQQFLVTTAGAPETLSMYIDPSSSGTDSIELGLYSDDGGTPDALLATTSSAMNPMPGTWLTLPIQGAPPLAVGSTYWLAYEVSGSSIHYRTGDLASVCVANMAYGAMPPAFPSAMSCSMNNRPWSFYATVQP